VRTVRATLLAFFALTYGVTLASHAATIGIPAPTWLAAGILLPFAFLGGLAGRPIGDRLGAEAFAMLAIALLAVAGTYTSVPRPLPLPVEIETPAMPEFQMALVDFRIFESLAVPTPGRHQPRIRMLNFMLVYCRLTIVSDFSMRLLLQTRGETACAPFLPI